MRLHSPLSDSTTPSSGLAWLNEGGELGQLIARFDWASTPLGPLEQWPQSLRTAVSLMLSSQHPMWIGWGPEATFLYNDAYISVLSRAKHPWALGRPAAVVWAEIWDVCGPLADKVFQEGKASFVNDVELFMKRGDFVEETYYSFSYSPIRDEQGRVGGLFCPSADVSSKVINARRLSTLAELTANALLEKTVDRAIETAFRTLAKNRRDLPFVALYLADASGAFAARRALSGLTERAHSFVPATVTLEGADSHLPVVRAMREREFVALPAPADVELPPGASDQPMETVVVLPLTSPHSEGALGVLVAGVNPNRRLDPEHRTFFELVAGQIASAIQNARSTEEQRRRTEELAELDRAKTAFFHNVSHEFRTPLTLMLGPLEDELREGRHSAARIDLAYRNALRLLKLVNTLLDFSRLEAGRFDAAFEPVDVSAYTAELASVFRSAIERAGLHLRLACAPLPHAVHVDRAMWEKVVFNLVSNALKFTLAGEIEVSVRDEGGRARISVRDTGSGIPAAELPQLFQRFHRVRNARARSHEGTGIGLALVLEIVRLHGGDIAVESAEGKGTTFTVSLPYGAGHLPADKLRRSAAIPAPSNARAFVEEARAWRPAPGAGPVAETRASGARIVLADDNNDMRDYVQGLLVARGHEVIAVADGQSALEIIRSDPPALVLSDVMMPRLDGFELLRALRGDPATQTIPFILLSARAGEEARVEGVEAGADDYLTKPFSARELVARVNTHLELAKTRAQLAAALAVRAEELEALVQERTTKLRDALGELEAFSYSIAHDLRAPLRSLQGFSDVLLAEYAPNLPAEAQGFLRRIYNSAARMDRLVQDVLSYSRIVRGELPFETVALDSLVRGIVETYPMFSPDKSVIEIEPPLPAVLGNEAMITQIVSNFLGNAVKFVPAEVKPHIRIRARVIDRKVRLLVQDNGIGIEARQHAHVWDMFYQVKQGQGGSGIGLAIVKKAAERMGGAVGVESAPGAGSTFWVELPAA